MDDIVSALVGLAHGQGSSHHKWEGTDRESRPENSQILSENSN